MKVPPKRKGNNPLLGIFRESGIGPLNESPSEKEGKCLALTGCRARAQALNESPSEKEGK